MSGKGEFKIDCTGDVVVGDTVRFDEAVFEGSFKNPKFKGNRTITALVVADSYGADKQQHTFSLKVLSCEGVQAQEVLDKAARNKKGEIRRKGRNIYRNITLRKEWSDESQRNMAVDEKHSRGAIARADRDIRKGLI